MTQFESSSGMALSWKTILLILPNSGVTFDALKTCSFCATLWIFFPVDCQVTRWPKGIDKARWTVRRWNLKVQVSFSSRDLQGVPFFQGILLMQTFCVCKKREHITMNKKKLCWLTKGGYVFQGVWLWTLKWLTTWFPYVLFEGLKSLEQPWRRRRVRPTLCFTFLESTGNLDNYFVFFEQCILCGILSCLTRKGSLFKPTFTTRSGNSFLNLGASSGLCDLPDDIVKSTARGNDTHLILSCTNYTFG